MAERLPPVTLGALAEVARSRGQRAELVGPGDPESVEVPDLTHDSRLVAPGVALCCVRGATDDGHRHAREAVAAGARALVVDHRLALDIAQLVVDDVRAVMAHLAAAVHRYPAEELDLIGVTGTNGKTTVVVLCEQLLAAAGRRALAIGTLTGARTTPESTDLQRILRRAVDEGVDSVVMEVSSHALDLGRVDGLHFDVAVFTNLGVDHLDFHGTQEQYFAAKARLFEPDRFTTAVLNVADVHGRLLADVVGGAAVEVDLRDTPDVTVGPDGVEALWRGRRLRSRLLGEHNLVDLLLAAEAVVARGVDPDVVVEAAPHLAGAPGRMQRVDAGQPFTVLVDYAHTPDALEEALKATRVLAERGGARSLVVFGCGGDRDRSKRPRMGEVACRLADVVVITSDNPRSEDPSAIIDAVRAGCEGGAPHVEIDRSRAIAWAIGQAKPGDVVLVAGKGHETTQVIGDDVAPFDDRVESGAALAAAGWAS